MVTKQVGSAIISKNEDDSGRNLHIDFEFWDAQSRCGGYVVMVKHSNRCKMVYRHAMLKSSLRLGLGFCTILAQIFCFFLLASIFHKNGMFKPVFCGFLVRRFLGPFLRRVLVRRFLRPCLCRFLVCRFLRRFSADFSSTFWRFKNRCSRVTQKCTENLRKNLRRPNGPALLGGVPHSISAFLSRQHVTQSPLGRRTQEEHVSVYRGIFGPKGMLAFAPRFFKNKNLWKIPSAKHSPLL